MSDLMPMSTLIQLISDNFLKILFGIFVFCLLGGTFPLLLEIVFVGIPMVITGYAYIVFMMSIFKDAGWVAPVAGLTCMGPALLVGKVCNELVQAFIRSSGATKMNLDYIDWLETLPRNRKPQR